MPCIILPYLLERSPASSRRWCRRMILAALLLFISLHLSAMTYAADKRLPADQTKRMNVLFIAMDDMNAEAGCLGSPIAQTPNIDRLAQRGLLFRRAYCQQPVCSPSRASLMTGMRPDTLRIWDLRTHFRDTHPEVVTLPQLFKQHGYHTRSIGKILHNGLPGDPDSWSQPEIYNRGGHPDDWYYPPGTPAEVITAQKGKKQPTQCVDVPDEAYFDGRIAREAIQALQTYQRGDEAFFLAVGFWKPHLPFNAPKTYWDLYDPAAIPGPAPATPPVNLPPIALHNFKELRGYIGMPKQGQPSSDQVKQLRHGYYAAISFVDAQVGKVIDELDRLGLADRTIIVLWSDHGFHIGEHALWAKTSTFELDARVPMIISVPGQTTAGRQTDALVELLDLYPTLADLAGLPAPSWLEGVSLRPLLEDPDQQVRAAALTQHPRPPYFKQQPEAMGYSIRTPRYRYTEWRAFEDDSVVARELYDHDTDPVESVNRADDPAMHEQVRELAQLLEKVVHP